MFVLLLEGGGGCGYSPLGCNSGWRLLKAKTLEDAHKEASKIVANYDDAGLEEVTILEVTHKEKFDHTGWLKLMAQKKKEEKEKRNLAERKAKYEQLKKEFG